jgi:type I site-specific restriction endonuclease
MKFPQLSFSPAPLNILQKNAHYYVWDEFRQKRILLTPEEWVRQHFLHFLVREKDFPKGRIAVEKGLVINGLTRRCDAVVYSDQLVPLVLVECKAPDIELSQTTLEQIAQYNFDLRVNYLILTNGVQTVVAIVDTEKKVMRYLTEVPMYHQIS